MNVQIKEVVYGHKGRKREIRKSIKHVIFIKLAKNIGQKHKIQKDVCTQNFMVSHRPQPGASGRKTKRPPTGISLTLPSKLERN